MNQVQHVHACFQNKTGPKLGLSRGLAEVGEGRLLMSACLHLEDSVRDRDSACPWNNQL